MKGGRARRALSLLLAALLIFSGWKLYGILAQYASGRAAYSSLKRYTAPARAASVSPRPTYSSNAQPSLSEAEAPLAEVDFEGLRSLNPDVVGWILCEDTPIDYPVAQTVNNDYYMDHMFDKTENSAGCIFLDYRNAPDFSDPHSILYGHHMKDGSMFAGITRYRQQAYYDAHPTARLLTPQGSYEIEWMAGYTTGTDSDAWRLDFEDRQALAEWAARASAQSDFKSAARATPQDRFITFSTCSYEFDQARYVLVGILKEKTDK